MVTLNVTVVFWEGKARIPDGRTSLWVLEYLARPPGEFTSFDKKRLRGLALKVAMKYDDLL